jgi:peptidoglycan/LPS O-acetylase OafA/YrhL
MPNEQGFSPGHRIREFEGLRGCLAWWVVLFHIYLHAGVKYEMSSGIERQVVFNGPVAVELFIILSGFVIALLLEGRREGYGVYIVRRFFRLAPVYYALVAVGIALAIRQNTYGDRLGQHILLHLTILHGLLPDEVLEGSATAFCHPAWSISVEWQFYLLAPFILSLVRRSAAKAVLLLVACLAISAFLLGRYTFPFHATVVMRAGLFAVGIGSYYTYRHAMRHRELWRPMAGYLLPLGVAAAWVFRSHPLSAGSLWILIFSAVLAHHVGAEGLLTRPLRGFLDLPPVVWLGQLSYSTYLCHNHALSLVESLLGDSYTRMSGRGRVLVLIALGAPMILAMSAALYHLIEKPGIRLGKEVSAWWFRPDPDRGVGPTAAVRVGDAKL